MPPPSARNKKTYFGDADWLCPAPALITSQPPTSSESATAQARERRKNCVILTWAFAIFESDPAQFEPQRKADVVKGKDQRCKNNLTRWFRQPVNHSHNRKAPENAQGVCPRTQVRTSAWIDISNRNEHKDR